MGTNGARPQYPEPVDVIVHFIRLYALYASVLKGSVSLSRRLISWWYTHTTSTLDVYDPLYRPDPSHIFR